MRPRPKRPALTFHRIMELGVFSWDMIMAFGVKIGEACKKRRFLPSALVITSSWLGVVLQNGLAEDSDPQSHSRFE